MEDYKLSIQFFLLNISLCISISLCVSSVKTPENWASGTLSLSQIIPCWLQEWVNYLLTDGEILTFSWWHQQQLLALVNYDSLYSLCSYFQDDRSFYDITSDVSNIVSPYFQVVQCFSYEDKSDIPHPPYMLDLQKLQVSNWVYGSGFSPSFLYVNGLW